MATNRGAMGGAVFFENAGFSTFFNNTLLRNQAGRGGGVYSGDGTDGIALVNNVVAFCSSGVTTSNSVQFRHNCVFGNGTNNFVGWPDPTGIDGNLSVDPQFIENPEFGTAHMKSDSPCRDAGDTGVAQADWLDINGGARVRGVAVDIGAEESGDLVRWDTVATNTGPRFEWTEPEPAVAPARFFRATSQP